VAGGESGSAIDGMVILVAAPAFRAGDVLRAGGGQDRVLFGIVVVGEYLDGNLLPGWHDVPILATETVTLELKEALLMMAGGRAVETSVPVRSVKGAAEA